MTIQVITPNSNTTEQPKCCICEYWHRSEYHTKYSTPVQVPQVHNEILFGFWMGMKVQQAITNGDTIHLCITHDASLKIIETSEKRRLEELEKKKLETQAEIDYRKRIDELGKK